MFSIAKIYTSKSLFKRNQQLKFEIWDVNKHFETDAKVVGSNLVRSNYFFIDNNVTEFNMLAILKSDHHCDKNNT